VISIKDDNPQDGVFPTEFMPKVNTEMEKISKMKEMADMNDVTLMLSKTEVQYLLSVLGAFERTNEKMGIQDDDDEKLVNTLILTKLEMLVLQNPEIEGSCSNEKDNRNLFGIAVLGTSSTGYAGLRLLRSA
jgi:hypothetical protein